MRELMPGFVAYVRRKFAESTANSYIGVRARRPSRELTHTPSTAAKG